MSVDFKALRQPFPAKDIEWRVQQSGVKNDKPWATVLAYLTNRAIQTRLDEVIGPDKWRNEFERAPEGGILCGISIKVGQYEWVTKWDGAENTDIESVKGGLSSAMKRAANQWGIGRYLYDLETTFVQPQESKGDHYIQIKDPESKQVVFTGYWNTPALPDWAMPGEPEKSAPKKQALSGNADEASLADRKKHLAELMQQLGITTAHLADFFQDAIGKEAPATLGDVNKAIKAAEARLGDEEDRAKELGARV